VIELDVQNQLNKFAMMILLAAGSNTYIHEEPGAMAIRSARKKSYRFSRVSKGSAFGGSAHPAVFKRRLTFSGF